MPEPDFFRDPRPSFAPAYPRLRVASDGPLPERFAFIPRELMTRLRRWRVEQCLTREALAQMAGISPATLKHAERTGEISLARLIAVAAALGIADEVERLFMRRTRWSPGLVIYRRMLRRVRGRAAVRRRVLGETAAGPPRR
jgi:transcriptional regulator with XRE-family HTH domain